MKAITIVALILLVVGCGKKQVSINDTSINDTSINETSLNEACLKEKISDYELSNSLDMIYNDSFIDDLSDEEYIRMKLFQEIYFV